MSAADAPWWESTSDHIRARLSFVDARGVTWQVMERDCSDAPNARGPFCLVFDSGEIVRRVWDYPPDWRALPADALADLSWRR